MNKEEELIYNRLYASVMSSIIPILQKKEKVLVMGDIVEPLMRALAAELASIKEEIHNGNGYSYYL